MKEEFDAVDKKEKILLEELAGKEKKPLLPAAMVDDDEEPQVEIVEERKVPDRFLIAEDPDKQLSLAE